MSPATVKSKRKSKTVQQIIPNTERKASGSNWEMYKNLFSKPKTEKNNEENSPRVSVNRHPKTRKITTTPRYMVILYYNFV